MNFITGYLVYFPAVMAGGLLVHQLWPGNHVSQLIFKFGLGIGLGLGLTSLFTFLILSISNHLTGFMVVQFILLLCALGLSRKNWKRNPLLPKKFIPGRTTKILLGVFTGILIITVSAYFLYALMTPTGRFDAWMIYNRTARFIFRDPENWRNTLSSQLYWLFHADYPLLVSVNVAGAWDALGSENMRAAQAQSAYFLIGIYCLLMGVLAALRTSGQAILAGIALLGMPVFFVTAAREEADIPLAFFILAVFALLFLYNREHNPALIALAGLAAGLAAWTKNEGLLFLVTGSIAWLIFLYRRKQIGRLKWYAFGLCLPLVVVLAYKLFLAPPNDLFSSGSSPGLIAHITDLERYIVIVKSFIQQFFTFGNGKSSIFLLAAYGLIMGLEKSGRHRLPALAAGFAILLQLAGYFMIYVFTPHDINWHLNSSLYRLILQNVPPALLILFVIINDPETIFTRAEKSSNSTQL